MKTNLRVETYNLCRKLENLFNKRFHGFPILPCKSKIYLPGHIPSKQIPIRILRGTFIAVLAVSQQIHVMKCHHPELIEEFVEISRGLYVIHLLS